MDKKDNDCETNVENPSAGCSPEISSDFPRVNEVVLKVSELESDPICRICYGGSSKERLLKPCKCKGTIEYVHRNCLERWLEEKNFEACELCHYRYQTKKTRKSCWDWLKQPETQSHRLRFMSDFNRFVFLTPLGIVIFWLFAQEAIYYQRVNSWTILCAILGFSIVVIYIEWIISCSRYIIFPTVFDLELLIPLQTCWEWLRQPETQSQRRTFIGDFTCFAFLTPLGIATFWLCAEGAVYYQRVKNGTLETIALVVLAVFLVLAYFTWIILCTRYHISLCNIWRNRHFNVRVIEAAPTELPSTTPTITQSPCISQERLLSTRIQEPSPATLRNQASPPDNTAPQIIIATCY